MGHYSWPVCNSCQGTGQIDAPAAAAGRGIKGEACPACKVEERDLVTGAVRVTGSGRLRPKGWVDTVFETCPTCHGAGHQMKVRGSDQRYEEEYRETYDDLRKRGHTHETAQAAAHQAGLEVALRTFPPAAPAGAGDQSTRVAS